MHSTAIRLGCWKKLMSGIGVLLECLRQTLFPVVGSLPAPPQFAARPPRYDGIYLPTTSASRRISCIRLAY
jgi:hypothetical protein